MLSGSEEWGCLQVTRNSRSEAGDVRWLTEDDVSVAAKGEVPSGPDRAKPALDSMWGPKEEILMSSPVACRVKAPRQRSKSTAGRREPGNLAMACRTIKTEAAAALGQTGQGQCGQTTTQTTHTLRARAPQVHLCHLQNADAAHSPARNASGGPGSGFSC